MGAKVFLVLGILLLSHVLIPNEVAAREMLQQPQTAEELKSDVDARRLIYKRGEPRARPHDPRGVGARPHDPPYNRRNCKSKYECRPPGP